MPDDVAVAWLQAADEEAWCQHAAEMAFSAFVGLIPACGVSVYVSGVQLEALGLAGDCSGLNAGNERGTDVGRAGTSAGSGGHSPGGNSATLSGSPRLQGAFLLQMDGNAPDRRHLQWQIQLQAGTHWTAGEDDRVNTVWRVLQPIMRASYEISFAHPRRRRRAWLSAIGSTGRAALPMLLEGKTEVEIAKSLHRSRHTIHDCVKQIYAAMGVQTRLELYQRWISGERPAHSSFTS